MFGFNHGAYLAYGSETMASYPRTTDEAITLIARAAANRAGVEKEIERCALALGTSVAALRATYYRHRPERLRATHARCKLTAQQSDTLARVLQAFSGANLGRRPGHLKKKYARSCSMSRFRQRG